MMRAGILGEPDAFFGAFAATVFVQHAILPVPIDVDVAFVFDVQGI